MTVPPDGRHPFYPPADEGPRHLHDETAEMGVVSNDPRHAAEPTGQIPRIHADRQQYPPGPQPSYPNPGYGPGNPPPQPKKRKRVFMWVFLAIQALFLIWVITGASSSGSSTAQSCAGQVGAALKTCQDASHVGTGIGIALIIILWAVVDIILGITYLIVRLARRH